MVPGWVADAIFYQIFPDRFARSGRIAAAGLEDWHAPPSHRGKKGGDLYGITDDNHWHYHYPPLLAILLTPLADPPAGASRSVSRSPEHTPAPPSSP